MNIYFAPLEGITGMIFRQAYEKNFGGIDRYYAPFVTTRDGGIMKKKEKRDILPENNKGIDLVPQIMTNSVEDFRKTAGQMAEMGYREVNLNLGCPSGTIVPKRKGAGFLREPEKLERFLDGIYTDAPLAISIKSRIGFYEPEEFRRLLDIYNQFPVKELILHLRTREEFYNGPVHEEAFEYAAEHSKNPLCYNGDVCFIEQIEKLKEKYPSLSSVMIGRGFLRCPGFVTGENRADKIYQFMTDLEQAYEEYMSGEVPVLFKMKEMWTYLQASFPEGEQWFRKIKKMKKLSEYKKFMREKFE